jgi:hypothetical protein
LDEGKVIRDFVHTRIVRPIETHEDIRVSWDLKPAQCLVQVPWSQLGGSSGPLHRLRQTIAFLFGHLTPSLTVDCQR